MIITERDKRLAGAKTRRAKAECHERCERRRIADEIGISLSGFQRRVIAWQRERPGITEQEAIELAKTGPAGTQALGSQRRKQRSAGEKP